MKEQNKLKELEDVIKKEIPEIMELKFGCKIVFKTLCRYCDNYTGNDYDICNDFECEKEIVTIDYRDKVEINYFGDIQLLDNNPLHTETHINALKGQLDVISKYQKGLVFKILGRPITMFDIKQCLDYNKTTNEKWLEISSIWNKPNNLNNQSEELIEVLYEELIKNKNS